MAINNIDVLNHGDILQIAYSAGIRNQISEDYRDWEFIQRLRYGNTAAREYKFLFQNSYGPAAIHYRTPGQSGRAFPRAQQATTSEHTALFKEINATIELEYNVWKRAAMSPEKYGEPLALEAMAKTTAGKRRLAADLYGDGSGALGTVLSVDDSTINSDGKIIVTLRGNEGDRGSVGMFEFDDLFTPHAPDKTVRLPTSDTDFGGLKVIDKDRENNTVTFQLLKIDGTVQTANTDFNSLVAGDVLYRGYFTSISGGGREGQPTLQDLTVSGFDYGSATEVIAGLESLAANDGRTIHGITMSGVNAGSRISAGGNPLDVKFIQKALSQGKTKVGGDAYSWKIMTMSPESHDALIESRETDRRFQTVTDNTKGTSKMHYIHENDNLEVYTSEYVPQNRIWMLPEQKASKGKVLEYIGSDYEIVKTPGGQDYLMKPSINGGYENTMISFLCGIGVLVCKHPAAVLSVSNFTNS